MGVPFRHDDDLERLGSAAFFLIDPDETGFRGALFLVNARGEPVEFAYNRIEVLQRFLWRPEQLRNHIARRLAASLFEICPRVPTMLLCRAVDVDAAVFSNELGVSIPVARVADASSVIGQTSVESRELAGDDGDVQLFWVGEAPLPASPERALVDELARRGLLTQPFERTATGLVEVYGSAEGPDVVD
jgi:hypothetical protein